MCHTSRLGFFNSEKASPCRSIMFRTGSDCVFCQEKTTWKGNSSVTRGEMVDFFLAICGGMD